MTIDDRIKKLENKLADKVGEKGIKTDLKGVTPSFDEDKFLELANKIIEQENDKKNSISQRRL